MRVDLTNEASTIVTDKLAAVARLRARLNDADTALDFNLTGKQGQVLWSIRCCSISARIRWRSKSRGNSERRRAERSSRCGSRRRISSTSRAAGSVNLAGEIPRVSGDFQLAKFQFPAAYTQLHADHAGHHQRAQRLSDER